MKVGAPHFHNSRIAGQRRSLAHAWIGVKLAGAIIAAALAVLNCCGVRAQDLPQPVAVANAPNLLRLEGTDAGSGVHYVRLFLSLPKEPNATEVAPRFTIECTENKKKREMAWFVSFGGVEDFAFTPPFRPTQTDLFPPRYPSANLKMVFVGYTTSKPFARAWAVLPSGELKYRNPGMESPNMESPRYFLQFLNSLPGFRISYAKPKKGEARELFFATQPLLDEIRKTAICEQ
ncbi:MAG: hypothetical protein WBE76_01185 [Terracidiphilus sp.]